MSKAGEDWANWGVAAAEDAALASFSAGGALLLWDPATEQPHLVNAAAQALLGGQASLPAPTRQRLNLLAGGLASANGIRLERLRLTASFAAVPVTCGSKLVSLADGRSALAIAVQASELRRLGITVPQVPPAEPAAAPIVTPPRVEAPSPAKPAMVRFLWQSDREGRLTKLSDNIAALTGQPAAAALIGQRWQDLLGSTFADSDGGLIERFDKPTTWSSHSVLWRTDSPGEAAPVELSGVPVGRAIIIAHTLSGALAASAGLMLVFRLGAAMPSIGQDWLLPSFLAPVLGGTLLAGGYVSVVGTILGAFLVTTIRSGLLVMQIGNFWLQLFLGLILLAAVMLDRYRSVYAERRSLGRRNSGRRA